MMSFQSLLWALGPVNFRLFFLYPVFTEEQCFRILYSTVQYRSVVVLCHFVILSCVPLARSCTLSNSKSWTYFLLLESSFKLENKRSIQLCE